MRQPYRLHVFVPAIMGAGLIFSIATLVRDLFRKRRGIEKYAALAGHATAAAVVIQEPREPPAGGPAAAAGSVGLRSHVFYVGVTVISWLTAALLMTGVLLAYAADGRSAHLAWPVAVAAIVATALGIIGSAATALLRHWPRPPSWVHPFLRASPLGIAPSGREGVPRTHLRWLTAATLAVAAAFAALVILVALSPDWMLRLDATISAELRTWQLPPVLKEHAADLGRTHVALTIAIAVGVSTLRCRIFAAAWLLAVVTGLGINTAVSALVDRPRPTGGGALNAFPSGHLVQVTLLAALLPLAVRVLTRWRVPGWLAGPVLVAGVAAIALSRVQDGGHWPADVIGGVLLGGLLALGTRWIVAHDDWHSSCASCPLRAPAAGAAGAEPGSAAPEPQAAQPAETRVLPLTPAIGRRLRWTAGIWLLATLAGFAVLALWVGLPTDPEGDVLASDIAAPIQVGLLVIAALGGLVTVRWEATGAALLAVSGLALGLLSALQYAPIVALAIVVVFAIPAILLWTVWQHRRPLGAVFLLAAVTAFALTAEGIAANRIHDHFFGPATAVSATPGLFTDRVEWVWSGGVTPTGATIVARLSDGQDRARLVVHGPAGALHLSEYVEAGDDRLVRLSVSGLDAQTEYTYAVEVDGRQDRTRGRGRFTTMPSGPASFTVAVASCARNGSNAAVFDTIRAADPLLYLITGDAHYANIAVNDTDAFLAAFDRMLTSPAQAALYRSVPVDYVWDDHDYGPNDAGADSPARAAARAAYRMAVPHPPLAEGPHGAIYHAFTIGRVRFVVTDTRSERTTETMLGAAQERWLVRELQRADDYALIVWVNSDPWIAPADPGADHWGGYPDERRRIADVIAAEEIDNLVMLSGDAHMVAIDDGTHSDYSTGGGGGFPVLHAAALDRPGSMKGGPYSAGAFPGAGQFGLLSVVDDGDGVTVTLEGRDHTGRILTSYRAAM